MVEARNASVLCAVSKHKTLQAFNSKKPQLAEDIFVAPNSSMIGDVSLGKSSSVWYGAVLRGMHTHIIQTDCANRLPYSNDVKSDAVPHDCCGGA